MAAEAPSAQIGRRSALEMDTPERTTQTASRNVVALKNRMGAVGGGGGCPAAQSAAAKF